MLEFDQTHAGRALELCGKGRHAHSTCFREADKRQLLFAMPFDEVDDRRDPIVTGWRVWGLKQLAVFIMVTTEQHQTLYPSAFNDDGKPVAMLLKLFMHNAKMRFELQTLIVV